MIWEQLYGLLLLATHPEKVLEGSDIEQVWIECAWTFAKNFCLIYEDKDVTPYLHQSGNHVSSAVTPMQLISTVVVLLTGLVL